MQIHLTFFHLVTTEGRNSESRRDWLNKNKGPRTTHPDQIRPDKEEMLTEVITAIIQGVGITMERIPHLSSLRKPTESPPKKTRSNITLILTPWVIIIIAFSINDDVVADLETCYCTNVCLWTAEYLPNTCNFLHPLVTFINLWVFTDFSHFFIP